MKFTLDMSNFDTVESHINVSFEHVVTVPVLIDGADSGVVLYVGTSPFQTCGKRLNNAAQIMDVAGRLKLVNEDDQQ